MLVWPWLGRGLSAEQTRWFEVMKPTCCLAVLCEVRECWQTVSAQVGQVWSKLVSQQLSSCVAAAVPSTPLPMSSCSSRRKVWQAGHGIAELHKSSSEIANLLILSCCITLSVASMKAALATYLRAYAYDWAAERRIWIVISSFSDDLTFSEQSSHPISEDGSEIPLSLFPPRRKVSGKHIWNSCSREEKTK